MALKKALKPDLKMALPPKKVQNGTKKALNPITDEKIYSEKRKLKI